MVSKVITSCLCVFFVSRFYTREQIIPIFVLYIILMCFYNTFFAILFFIEIDTAREIGDAENSSRSIGHSQRCCDDRLSDGTSAS